MSGFRMFPYRMLENKGQEIVGRTPSKPLTDYRALPCWGLYLHNLDRVILRNVRLVCESGKVSPASCFDNGVRGDL